jgi:lysophospholipid acyltransferase (LPLAT)-like uncharacterized protein
VEAAKQRGGSFESALTVVAAWFLRALTATLRYRVDGYDVIPDTLAAGTSVVVFGWHELLLVAACHLPEYHPYIMISQSRDGERIARVVERIGWKVVRGSSSRGGARALLEMVRALRTTTLAGHLIDGPRGPRHVVKPGIVTLAQRSRAVLLPTVYYTAWKWTAPSWDRMQVPLPFARIVGRMLPPRCVPPDLDDEAVAALCQELGDELETAYAQLAMEHSGQPAPAKSRI